MKNKEPFRRKIVRLYYTIKGFFAERKMEKGCYYATKHIPNSRFMYRGKRLFYRAYAASPYPGVIYQSQDKVTYKYWEIGILDFKKG